MDPNQSASILQEGVSVVVRLAAPMLLLCLVVGVVVAILQAVTQIHEQSIAFILKATVVILILLIGGGWMLTTLQEFALRLFDMML